jgi:hypothetical protein
LLHLDVKLLRCNLSIFRLLSIANEPRARTASLVRVVGREKSRVSRLLFVILGMLSCALPSRAMSGAELERGTAIIDPYALRELDHGRFGLARILSPARSTDAPLTDDQLFALPAMAPVRKVLDEEYESYVARHKAALPNETIGAGPSFDFQEFDYALLHAPDTRFVLAGIVNRMDRTYVSEANCGEVRLIYRLTRLTPPPAVAGDEVPSPRLPMTLNVVLKAKPDPAADGSGTAASCAEIAGRWLAAGELSLTGADLAARLTAKDGPLDLIRPENVYRIETNLQIAHVPKSAAHEFRTDYLLNVFDYDAHSATFEQATLENQVDRDRLLADATLRRDFKDWLLDPAHFREFDRGTILIPERFLAKGAIAATPVGFSPSDLQPAFGLVAGDASTATPVFQERDIVAALRKAAADGVTLQNIQSVAGFERRLNDVSCTGCHQTRAIGGFHFPGVDWMTDKPSNDTIVPASPHFFGDQVRRRDILVALRDGKEADFSRGFASRPQVRGSTELAGTQYLDGWGAHCYSQHAKGDDNDRSFQSWTCAQGLACQVGPASRMGMCFIPSPREVKAEGSAHD